MSSSTPLSRRSGQRPPPRATAVTVGALAAVVLAAAALPLDDRVATSVPAPAATSAAPSVAPSVAADTPTTPAATTVATTSGRAAPPTGPPPTDRAPSLLGAGGVPTPPAPSRSTLARSEPTRVHIPAIGVDTHLVGLGLDEQGRMEVPPGAFPAGWYTGAPTPGELGPAILAGHVDHGGVAGVFFRLRELRPGDAVEVTREDGTVVVFRVTRVEQHAKDAFPTAAVYGDIDHAGLRLITCGGAFDRRAHSYEDNIVVFAERDPSGRE